MLMSEAAVIPLFSVDDSILVREGVTGFTETPTSAYSVRKLDKEVR